MHPTPAAPSPAPAGTPVPGHLYGPPTPTIGFWYGEWFLGQARGTPSQLEEARWRVRESLELLEPGPRGAAKRARLAYGATAVLYFGSESRLLQRGI